MTEWKMLQMERKARMTHKFELEGNGVLGTKSSLFMPKRPNSSYGQNKRKSIGFDDTNGSETKIKVSPFDLMKREESSD